MKSILTKEFHKRFARLPPDIQKQARATYRLWKVNPHYPSLHFKPIIGEEQVYSVRIGLRYRAVGTKIDNNTILWNFIGTHAEYDQLF